MYELYPYFTNDGSVGLYSPDADDIYHSTYGALTEAYQKFVIPAEFEKYFENNSEIKILDICYGIGYNTKSFLNFYFEKILRKNSKKNCKKKTCSDTIHTNNIFNLVFQKNTAQHINCNDTIYSDNNFDKNSEIPSTKNKIFIKTIDTDKNLVYLSPFLKNFGINKKMLFKHEKIAKLSKVKVDSKYRLDNKINHFIFNELLNSCTDFLYNSEFENLLFNEKYIDYFNKDIINLYKAYKFSRGNKRSINKISTFLHNIYYRNISMRHKKALKPFKIDDLLIDFKINDARVILQEDRNVYNFIFLDAFTPTKCPCLWSFEFAKLLYSHLDDNGMILTYSNSANIRNAFLNAGFYVGKNFCEENNKYMGTVFAKNKSLIKYELSEYDLGLIKTKAGIFYRDKNLDSLNAEILASHKNEVENSDLISSSQFIKQFKKK